MGGDVGKAIGAGVGSVLGGVVTGNIGAALGAPSGAKAYSDATKMPRAGKPAVMPLVDDLAVQQAKAKEIASALSRRGRSSTILTGDSEKLG